MERLKFITEHGVCGLTAEWNHEDSKFDADGWLEMFGARIGSGTAPLPTGGWVDLARFAVVQKSNED